MPPTNLDHVTFRKYVIVFSTKVNLLYLLYLTALWRCLQHGINQRSLLNVFLRTLIFMTQVSFYLFSLLEIMFNWVRNFAVFLISGLGSCLLNQLQTFWQLYLINCHVFYNPGTIPTVTLEIFKAFDRVWNASLLHKLKYCRNSGGIFGLILSFLSNRRFWVVLDGKSSQDYSIKAGVPKIPFLVLKFS